MQPVRRRRNDAPDVGGILEFHADLLQFAHAWRPMNRAYPRSNRRWLGLDAQAHDLQRDPGLYATIVAGRIAAAVQVYAGRNSSLHKRFAAAILAEDDQRNGAVDARAAAQFFLNNTIRGSRKRGLAHVCSLERHSGFPVVFGAGRFTGEVSPLPGP